MNTFFKYLMKTMSTTPITISGIFTIREVVVACNEAMCVLTLMII